MYTHMSIHTPSLIIDRAISLHKMIRLITISTNGGGYLNFMGNEFGHPEWIDFPREGNGWSYKYARRQWGLAEDKNLKYGFLEKFDIEMVNLARNVPFTPSKKAFKNHSNPSDQVIAFEQGDFLFVFNFNPVKSFTDYGIPSRPTDYKIILNSDSSDLGGFDRVDTNLIYEPERIGSLDSDYFLKLYLPSRSAMVLKSIPIPKAK